MNFGEKILNQNPFFMRKRKKDLARPIRMRRAPIRELYQGHDGQSSESYHRGRGKIEPALVLGQKEERPGENHPQTISRESHVERRVPKVEKKVFD